MRYLFTILIAFAVAHSVNAQHADWWERFCNGELDLSGSEALKSFTTDSKNTEDRAKSYLMNAFGQYHEGLNDPEMPFEVANTLRFIQYDIIGQETGRAKARITNDPCFNKRFHALLDSLRNKARADVKKAVTAEMRAKGKELIQELILLESNLPPTLKTCADVSVAVSNNLMDVVFIIDINDCNAQIVRDSVDPGKTDKDYVFEAICDWYLDSVLIKLGRDPDRERDNTIIEVTGKADGISVDSDLSFSHQLYIPAGKEYSYITTGDFAMNRVLEQPIDQVILWSNRSNEFLALVRACQAEGHMQTIASRVSVVVREYEEIGGQYRGVIIKITARGVLESYANRMFQEAKKREGELLRDLDNIEKTLNTHSKK